MSNIKVVYLTTGEQIVGNISEEKDTSVIMEHPLAFVQQTQDKFGFVEYISPISSDESVEIDHVDIRHVLNPTAEVKAHWEKNFGAGLVVPEEPKLILS